MRPTNAVLLRLVSGLAILLAVAAPAPATAADATWRGEYYTNTSLAGDPALVRSDATIDFNWGNGSPAAGIPVDNFSARWTRIVSLPAGNYRFSATADDGVRLFVDGRLLIEQWRITAPTTYNADLSLGAGDHSLRVEYFEASLGAIVRVSWQNLDAPNPGTGDWRGEYFNNASLSGAPALVRNDATIDFNWGNGAPAGGLPADNFSVRWTRTVALPAGSYRFNATADDGVRVFVDGRLLIDQWRIQSPATYSATSALDGGTHSFRVEYFEASLGALMRFGWEQLDAPAPNPNAWRAEYFANVRLAGSPVLVRNDPNPRFDWGLGAPASGLPVDGFSVRWTRTTTFSGGLYEFTLRADDGVRFWLDGVSLIDQWHNASAQTYRRQWDVSAGSHTLRLEYFERAGLALVDLRWQKVETAQVGNLITCMYPSDSWIKVYRLEDGNRWEDLKPSGWGPLDKTGVIKIDGLRVDPSYGQSGHPYHVEMWGHGNLEHAVGNTAAGQPAFRIFPGVDNRTPWPCPNATLKRGPNELR